MMMLAPWAEEEGLRKTTRASLRFYLLAYLVDCTLLKGGIINLDNSLVPSCLSRFLADQNSEQQVTWTIVVDWDDKGKK